MTSRTHTPEDVQKIMESWRDSASEYERGFIDGMQKQMQSSVDKAVNAMTQPTYYIPNKNERTWVGLTDKDWNRSKHNYDFQKGVDWAEPILKQKNGYAEE